MSGFKIPLFLVNITDYFYLIKTREKTCAFVVYQSESRSCVVILHLKITAHSFDDVSLIDWSLKSVVSSSELHNHYILSIDLVVGDISLNLRFIEEYSIAFFFFEFLKERKYIVNLVIWFEISTEFNVSHSKKLKIDFIHREV